MGELWLGGENLSEVADRFGISMGGRAHSRHYPPHFLTAMFQWQRKYWLVMRYPVSDFQNVVAHRACNSRIEPVFIWEDFGGVIYCQP